ncbi:MAG: hypothetical protein AAGC97_02165 [Planctomycetota bacterium]
MTAATDSLGGHPFQVHCLAFGWANGVVTAMHGRTEMLAPAKSVQAPSNLLRCGLADKQKKA